MFASDSKFRKRVEKDLSWIEGLANRFGGKYSNVKKKFAQDDLQGIYGANEDINFEEIELLNSKIDQFNDEKHTFLSKFKSATMNVAECLTNLHESMSSLSKIISTAIPKFVEMEALNSNNFKDIVTPVSNSLHYLSDGLKEWSIGIKMSESSLRKYILPFISQANIDSSNMKEVGLLLTLDV